MRPLRFLILLALFVVLPVILTCVSLFSTEKVNPEQVNLGYRPRNGPFKALFSFSTPSSLFPPSAIISLTDDNSTSFLARPAAFGPSLPSKGLSGQLWIGKGFGEEPVSEDYLRFSGYELGCSDVPGWDYEHKPKSGQTTSDVKSVNSKGGKAIKDSDSIPKPRSKRDRRSEDTGDFSKLKQDGTDDHLHHPLPDSNPASLEKPGEPASNNNQDKTKAPNHADIESLQESADIAGKVVMLSRGGCGFLEKVKWAQRRGGLAVIVGDNVPGGSLIVMYANSDTSNVTIPAVFTSYYSAHLLSSLVPWENKPAASEEGNLSLSKDSKGKEKGPGNDRKITGTKAPISPKDNGDAPSDPSSEKGWVQNVLSVVGIDNDADAQGEDSRRPPGSGNIDWVLLEDWDEDKPAITTASVQTHKSTKTASLSGKNAKSQVTSANHAGNDDFVIGVQDWRDTELIAPKSTMTQGSNKQKGKIDAAATKSSTSSSSIKPTATALKGGSITPGSGEYDHEKEKEKAQDKQNQASKSVSTDNLVESQDRQSLLEWILSFIFGREKQILHPRPDEHLSDPDSKNGRDGNNDKHKPPKKQHEGVWVTLTPANQSTNPFFDTLLVLVVSPLVTLTFVYGLLLLRSRIRRRRWRAPKSIVERLPVRTYQTMSSTTSSTTSSATGSPTASLHTSPDLRPTSHSRTRPRSQTTAGVLSTSPSTEKPVSRTSPKRKRYTGRQVECVVCLEEYVDGESQVMSLPCGHEFHVDCITPWLVTRRRTCPICKGDVVRSFTRNHGDVSGTADDATEAGEQTSDDVQDRAAMTQNRDSSAAIPIPLVQVTPSNNDIERGSTVETPLLGSTPRVPQSRWRGLLQNSLGRLSGETVWRSSSSSMTDRNR